MQSIMDQPEKAIRGFTTLLGSRPHYMPALEEIVSLYSTQSQDNKKYQENMHRALELYEAAYLHYSSMPDRFATASDDPFDVLVENQQEGEPFGYSALNMLSDLYIMFEEYEKPLQIIKTWSRRLQKRAHQTWWDDYKDDREFDTDAYDEELQASLGENRTRGLPIDLRIKIGTCRLMLEEVKEAKVGGANFERQGLIYLTQEPPMKLTRIDDFVYRLSSNICGSARWRTFLIYMRVLLNSMSRR